jgi:3-dehydroquinate dehydratase
MLRRTLILDRGRRPHSACRHPRALRALKEPLIDLSLWNIYPCETFRKHLGASLAGGVIRGVGRPGGPMAPDALAALLNDAR